MSKQSTTVIGIAATFLGTLALQPTIFAQEPPKPDFQPFDQVSKDYEKVVTTTDGSFYNLWIDKKHNQLLAELPRGWEGQKHFIAVTQASGGVFAGLQGPSTYVYWKRYDKRLALIEPQIDTRSTGEVQSKNSVERLFTDKVLLDIPIVSMGPNGQPVIDLDDLLINQAGALVGGGGRGGGGAGGINPRLATITKAKSFPQNNEIAIEVPAAGGSFVTFHYSISSIPEKSDYKPREADERIGYFTTVYRDLGQYDQEKKWTRYIDRWSLEKRDPKLKLSPPKEPIIYYVENTVPVRYRRWLRDGVLYWNEAFKAVGIDNAIEVQYQDKESKAHMEKDPEDVRYNFIRWLNNDVSTAIGPHRANPLTGQILDADVVLTDGWIRAYWGWFHEDAPELAVDTMSPQTLTWLEDHPNWDPRVLLSSPERRQQILAQRADRKRRIAAGEVVPMSTDPAVMLNPDQAAIAEWTCGPQSQCMAAHGLAFEMSFAMAALEALDLLPEDAQADAAEAGESLDGIPEWFVGPLLSELVCHEIGHTLGLRHNFKASSIYTLAQINSAEWKGKKTLAGSVMDYLPPNFNKDSGEIQGDYTMIGVGPYDMWAIEYGYTFDDPKKVLARCAEPELAYLTDDDTGGPDPFAMRYDFSANPLDYAKNQMRIVTQQRSNVLNKFVKDGQSWSKARRGYERTLSMQIRCLGMMADWIGGTHVNRDRKGDPNGRAPTQVVSTKAQRDALQFIIDTTFNDAAFGITPEIVAHMTVDKWGDDGAPDKGESTWPIHDRVMGVQASVLTMIMNPSTLQHVYDNEFRLPADQDAITLPEVLQKTSDAIYGEIDPSKLDGKTWTARNPMISSLRRNLQSELTDRLIYLSVETAGMPRAIRTLATMHLKTLKSKLDATLAKNKGGQVDEYTTAHLTDLKDRVDRALNTVQVTGVK